MSHVHIKKISEKRCGSSGALVEAGQKFFSLTMDSALDFLKQSTKIISPHLPEVKSCGPQKSCEIPEVDCPPRCVCEISWNVSPAEKVKCAIRITNTSKKARRFVVDAVPFKDADGTIAKIVFEPDILRLNAGETGTVKASMCVPSEFEHGKYYTEILVKGAYEQCIKVSLDIQCEEQCVCEISQGEIPQRVRAHRWYDHFQCVEPCFEPSDEKQPPKVPPIERIVQVDNLKTEEEIKKLRAEAKKNSRDSE